MGLHGFSFGELIFDDCRVPAANRLGPEGDGLSVAYSSSVLYGRPNLAAVSLGIHQAIVEETSSFVEHSARRPLTELPTVQQKLGQMQSPLMTARVAAYHAVPHAGRGDALRRRPDERQAASTWSPSLDSARTAMEVHAAHGLSAGRRLERSRARRVPHLRPGRHLGHSARCAWPRSPWHDVAPVVERSPSNWSSSAWPAELKARSSGPGRTARRLAGSSRRGGDQVHGLGGHGLDQLHARPSPFARLGGHRAHRAEDDAACGRSAGRRCTSASRSRRRRGCPRTAGRPTRRRARAPGAAPPRAGSSRGRAIVRPGPAPARTAPPRRVRLGCRA